MTNDEAVRILIEPIERYIQLQGCWAYPVSGIYPTRPYSFKLADLDTHPHIRCGCDWEEDHTNFWQALSQLKQLVEDVAEVVED